MKLKDYRDLKVWQKGMRQSLPCHYGVMSPTVIARSMSDEAISIPLPAIPRERSDRRISMGGVVGLPRFARNDIREKARNDIMEKAGNDGREKAGNDKKVARMLATLVSRLGRAPSDERLATS